MHDTPDLSNWKPRPRPGLSALVGHYARCEPYQKKKYAADLFQVFSGQEHANLWTYMPIGPFAEQVDLEAMLAYVNPGSPSETSWQTMVLRSVASGRVLGMASYMRIREAHGSAEVGAVTFSKKMQRSATATDAIYLMARHVFEDLDYRRYEWKCDNANEASKRAAVRFGFSFEGVFRNDMVVKGKNRDTAWYAMTNSDWPAIGGDYTTWLSPSNFGEDGQQKSKLAASGSA